MINYDIEEFCCEHCLLSNVLEAMFEIQSMNDGKYTSVAIMCNEDLTEKLIKLFGNTTLNDFEFDFTFLDFDKIDYGSEYVIIVNTEGEVSVDKAYYDDGELQTFDEDLIFISDECSSRLFINQVGFNDNIISFGIGHDEDGNEFEEED